MPIFSDAANGITAQDLLPGIAYGESRGDPNTRYGPWTKHGRAMGEYQIMPDTARRFGYNPEEMFDPTKGADVATKYLTFLLNRFGNARQAIEAYNTGEGNVSKGIIPPETQSYAKGVLDYLQSRGAGQKIQQRANVAGRHIDPYTPPPSHVEPAKQEPPKDEPFNPQFIADALRQGLFGKVANIGTDWSGQMPETDTPPAKAPFLSGLFHRNSVQGIQ